MKLIECPNGHLYDSDKYGLCPICDTMDIWESLNPDLIIPYASIDPPGKDSDHRDTFPPEEEWRNIPTEPPEGLWGYAGSDTPSNTGASRDFAPGAHNAAGYPISRAFLSGSPLPASLLPEEWKDWRIRKVLGHGSTGNVFQVEEVRRYAVKVIPWKTPASKERAHREYTTARLLADHPHAIQYLQIRDHNRATYLLQELSVPYREYALTHPVTVEEVLTVIREISSALAALHEKGYQHMDVNPQNIFLVNGTAKLGDFSHSLSFHEGDRHQQRVGTSQYIAPEVLSLGAYSGKEDLYSLGICMYNMLTGGKLPFDFSGRSPAVRLENDRIRSFYLNSDLAAMIGKAAAFRPEDRYASAAEFSDAISAFTELYPEFLTEQVPAPSGRSPDITAGTWSQPQKGLNGPEET